MFRYVLAWLSDNLHGSINNDVTGKLDFVRDRIQCRNLPSKFSVPVDIGEYEILAKTTVSKQMDFTGLISNDDKRLWNGNIALGGTW